MVLLLILPSSVTLWILSQTYQIGFHFGSTNLLKGLEEVTEVEEDFKEVRLVA
jgi:hypothetical protein